MSLDRQIDADKIAQHLQHIMPTRGILLKIINAIKNPETSATDLEEILISEPSFNLKLLVLANSAFYGHSGQISNTRQAIVLLGYDVIRNLAIQVSVNKLFTMGNVTKHFTGYQLWKHSIGVATYNKIIAGYLKLEHIEDYYTMGILHDIGYIIEYQFFKDLFLEILQQAEAGEKSIVEYERSIIHTDHASLTQVLCEKLQLPISLSASIQYHHEPFRANPDDRRPACMLYLADQEVASNQFGVHFKYQEAVSEEVMDCLNLTSDDLVILQDQFEQEISRAAITLR